MCVVVVASSSEFYTTRKEGMKEGRQGGREAREERKQAMLCFRRPRELELAVLYLQQQLINQTSGLLKEVYKATHVCAYA